MGCSLASFVSKVLGFVRDALLVSLFGGGKLSDAYYAAFRISSLFRKTVGEGALNASLVPIMTKEKEISHEKSVNFFSAALILSVGISILACALAIIFRYDIIKLISYGFLKDPAQYELTVFLTAILMPQIIFITIAAVFQSALNVSKKFFLPALTPSIFSITIIVYLIALHKNFLYGFDLDKKLIILAALATLSGAIQCLVLFPALKKEKYSVKFANPFKNPKTVTALVMMLPAILSMAQDQIALLINTAFASFMIPGSVTAVYNSARIAHFPLAIFAAATAHVALPHFSKNLLLSEKEEFKDTFNFSIKLTAMILIPATIGLLTLALPIVRTLFEHGQFSYAQSEITAKALFFFSIGLLSYGVNKIAGAAYYASGDMKFILKITIFQMILNILLCFVFAKRMGAGGLMLATSISALLASAWFLKSLNKKFGGIIKRTTLIFMVKVLAASLIMGIFAKYSISFAVLIGGHTAATVIIICLSVFLYFALLKFFKIKEIKIKR